MKSVVMVGESFAPEPSAEFTSDESLVSFLTANGGATSLQTNPFLVKLREVIALGLLFIETKPSEVD